MAKAQKTKGRNQEYVLRNHLRALGWEAERVYASGAIKGLPGDVKATKAPYGTKLFEMKSRKDLFKSIYVLYEEHIKTKGDDVMSIAISEAKYLCLNLSSSLEAALGAVDHHINMELHPLYKKHKRTFGKIKNLEKLLGEADVLAIKDDRRPLLFIRYYK